MILHCVLLEPADDAAMTQVVAAMGILSTLTKQVPGFEAFQHGPNRDYEGKSARYAYGFLCTFADRDALATYADHPDHRRAGGMLIAACKGGAEGIFVSDLEV